jgi:hypothetical protein
MSTVDLRYGGSTPMTINLAHADVCCRAGQCLCRNGRWASIHFMPGLWQRGLSDAVLHAPEIVAMITAGALRVRQAPVHASSADAETTPETQAPLRRRTRNKDKE